MSDYHTGNPVPSIDPRDLDDNATIFDKLLNSTDPSVQDRLGVLRKTWYKLEQDAIDVTNPNLVALSALTGVADRLPYFNGPDAMSLAVFTAQARQLLDDTSFAAMLVTLGAAPVASPGLTGVPTAPTATPGTNSTQLATTAFVEAVRIALAPLASPSFTGSPTAPTAPVGTSTTQLATTAMVQAEIANKRPWATFATVLTAQSGTFTSASATMKYMVAFGVCHIQAVVTITTKGTGTVPVLTLPFAPLGADPMPIPARENLLNGKSGYMTIFPGGSGSIVAYDNTDLVTGNGSKIYVNGSYPIA